MIETDVDIGPVIDESSGLDEVFELAQQLRVDSVRASTAAGSGHPTSSMSAADLMAVLQTRHLRYNWQEPGDRANDHLVFSKGHASPLLYSMFRAAGVVSQEELLTGYRRIGSRLEGHPTPVLPWVDAATGSLGQGIGIAVGIALAAKEVTKTPSRVWVLCGDSEMAEGSVWEALDRAAFHGLANLTVIVDVNRLGQRGPTELEWDLEAYARRVEGFGCAALQIDGHDLTQIDDALGTAARLGRPTVVLARTRKGRGFSEVEDKPGWHGKALPPEQADRAIAELGGIRSLTAHSKAPERFDGELPGAAGRGAGVALPVYTMGEAVAPRKAFGDALAALGDARGDVVVFDAEVGNSTFTEQFGRAHPERFFQSFIAEQQMLSGAVGMAVSGLRPYAATFAAFLTRAHDFIRMAAITGADIALVGTHCGVEIGPDGPSQMGVEDVAMMRAIHSSTVLYPSDGTSAAALTAAMANLPGISYLRATRGDYPVLYGPQETFPVGGSKTHHAGDHDRVTLVGAGVTLHECLKAREELAADGTAARVVDLYSVKPLDARTLERCALETGALVVVEDHHPEGGIAEAVLAAMSDLGVAVPLVRLAVTSLPGSGTPAECLDAAGISAAHIAQAARKLIDDLSGQQRRP